MAHSSKRRTVFLALVLLLLAGFLVPSFVNLNRFRRQIAQALAAGLGRPVEVGEVRLKLLPAPGLVAQNVVVGEDPAFGAEHFVRMTELRANVRLPSLWTGRLSFSSLVFVEPSVNLARRADGRWNVSTLFGPLRGRTTAGRADPALRDAIRPYVEFQDGRINFKDGDLKSVFFFSAVDGAVYHEGGRWRLRFQGAPSRTDRATTEAGEIRAEGQFAPDGSLKLGVRLGNAFLTDLLELAGGSNYGIHGVMGITAEVTGRPEALRLEGQAELADLHRSDLVPPQGSPALKLVFSGTGDFPARCLELVSVRSPAGTFQASGQVTGFLDRPSWDFHLRFEDLDAGRMFAAVQHFSSRLSPDSRMAGRIQGALRATGPQFALEGQVTLKGLSLEAQQRPRSAALRVAEARLVFSGSQIRLEPVNLVLERGAGALTLGVSWNWAAPRTPAGNPAPPPRTSSRTGRASPATYLEVAATGRNLSLRSLAPLVAALGGPRLPEEGWVSLNTRLGLERGGPLRLTGSALVERVRLAPAWLAEPVVVYTARLDFAGDRVKAERLVATVGEITATGAVNAPLRSHPAVTASLHIPEAGTGSLSRLFSPARSVLALSSPPSPADFFSSLVGEGVVEVGRFRLRGLMLEKLQAGFSLASRQLVLRDVRAAWAGGKVTGQVRLNFSRPTPEYDGRARLEGVSLEALAPDLASGVAAGTLEVTAAGRSAEDINNSLRLRGRFSGLDLTVKSTALAQALEQSEFDSAAADVLAQNRRIRFLRLLLKSESAALEATGSVGFDRTLELDFREAPNPQSKIQNPRLTGSFRLVGPLVQPSRRAGPAETARTQSK